MTRVFLILITCVLAASASFAKDAREDQVKTCEAILAGQPGQRECSKIFPTNGICCIQYRERPLAKYCSKMPNIQLALSCFVHIHEVGFWKTDLIDENEVGLANKFVMQWKKNVMQVCSKYRQKAEAIDCAILQKSGTRFGYQQRNESIAKQSLLADPIIAFCRKTFGDYWQGVESCIKDQKAAKKRLGF